MVAPRLQAVIEREKDTAAKSEMVENLGFLLEASNQYAGYDLALYKSFLEERLSTREEPAVRFAAATALVPILCVTTPRSVIDILLDAISRPSEYSRFFTSSAVPGEAAKALSFFGPEQGVPALIEGLRRSEGYPSVHDIIERLLDLAFRGKQAHNYARTYRTTKDGVGDTGTLCAAPSAATMKAFGSPSPGFSGRARRKFLPGRTRGR